MGCFDPGFSCLVLSCLVLSCLVLSCLCFSPLKVFLGISYQLKPLLCLKSALMQTYLLIRSIFTSYWIFSTSIRIGLDYICLSLIVYCRPLHLFLLFPFSFSSRAFFFVLTTCWGKKLPFGGVLTRFFKSNWLRMTI